MTLIAAGVLAGAPQAWARGGGGCLAAGTGILTPAGEVAIESLHRGDAVIGWRDGQKILTTVADVFAVQPAEFIEIVSGGGTLRVTPEHPVAIAAGIFIAADRLPAAATRGARTSATRNPRRRGRHVLRQRPAGP